MTSSNRTIVLLASAPILLGMLLQKVIAPSAPAQVIFAALISAGLLAVSFGARGRLLEIVSGYRLASLVLVMLAAFCAIGTLVLQGKPARDYLAQYGAASSVILALRLDDIFHSLWFGGLIALLVAGLVASSLRRWPITGANIGFFAAHLGILAILLGAALGAVWSIKGRVDLRVDGPAVDSVSVTQSGRPLPAKIPLGASVRLEQFDVNHYTPKPRLNVYLPAKDSQLQLKASFEPEIGAKHRLPGGAWFQVTAYYPDLVSHEKLVVNKDGLPALRLTIDEQETWLMPNSPAANLAADRSYVRSGDGRVMVLFGEQRPPLPSDGPLHTIKDAAGHEQPIRLGQTIALPEGAKVTALRFFPNFSYDIERHEAFNVEPSDDFANPDRRPTANPALEIEVGGKKHWLFAKMPGFAHGAAAPRLTYVFSPSGTATADTVILVSNAQRTVTIRRANQSEETLPYQDGLRIGNIRLDALLPHAVIERELSTASSQPKNPAAIVEFNNSQKTNSVLLIANHREKIDLADQGLLTLENHGNDVKSFVSQVAVEQNAQRQKIQIAVNHPGRVGRFLLYQANFDPKDPSYSGFDAVYDPGVPIVFTGFSLLFLGVGYMFYLAPRRRAHS